MRRFKSQSVLVAQASTSPGRDISGLAAELAFFFLVPVSADRAPNAGERTESESTQSEDFCFWVGDGGWVGGAGGLTPGLCGIY